MKTKEAFAKIRELSEARAYKKGECLDRIQAICGEVMATPDVQPAEGVELSVDPARVGELPLTGIPVRSRVGGRYGPVDIVDLDRESLLKVLRGRPGFSERLVCLLLGHQDPGH